MLSSLYAMLFSSYAELFVGRISMLLQTVQLCIANMKFRLKNKNIADAWTLWRENYLFIKFFELFKTFDTWNGKNSGKNLSRNAYWTFSRRKYRARDCFGND